MDRINLAIQGAADLEQMMESVLDAVLNIFNCDRAALVYPCDPESHTWCVPMERTRPNYPGARARQAGDIPITPHVAETFRILRAASGPVKFGPRTVGEVSDEYQIKSWISMAIYPKCGKPWQFLLHQCSDERTWMPEEERLFQEIGRRISDALSNRDLSKKERKYEEIFGNVSDSLTLYDITPDGRLLLADMNPCAERIMGISKSEAVGLFFEEAVPNEIAARHLPLCRRCLETGEPLTFDEDLKLAPGIRALNTTLLPVRNQSGSVYRLIVLNQDITERKAYEQQLRLLMREVNHRTKNLLSVVQAVVHNTAGEDDPKQFEERLRERISALAANHDLLVNSEWRGVGMEKLAAAQLAHFGDLLGSRIVFGGPPVLLTPEASQTIGMALHELATNSSKYGALSRKTGSVRIEWSIASKDEGTFFKIRWSEHGGPPAKPPQRHGFGHEVMVELAEYTLDAKVSLTYPSSGLVWDLIAPAAVTIQPALSGRTEGSIV
jgi:PAS domain S-box-containing protein